MIIKNARVIDPSQNIDEVTDITIENGKIVKVGKNDQPDDTIVHADGWIAAPGFIDAHVHFRDPGFTYKEDIVSGSNAAKKGGFTTVIMMGNTKPCMDNVETIDDVLTRGKKTGIHVHCVGNVTKGMKGEELTDFALLKEHGITLLSDDGLPILDSKVFKKALEEAKKNDLVISLHEEDNRLIETKGIAQGPVAESLGINGAPWDAEASLVARDCVLAGSIGARIHVQHLSSGHTVEVIRVARKQGIPVTAEVTPSHFSLTDEAVKEYGTLAKVNPPIRTSWDRDMLRAGLKDGTIDLIATDHAPHSKEEKAKPFAQAPSGIVGLETSVSLGIMNLVDTGVLTWSEWVRKMSTNAAEMFHLPGGTLKEGSVADIVLINPEETYVADHFASKGTNTPFYGKTLKGKVKMTISEGKIVYSD